MYDYIKGIIANIGEMTVTVDVNGVGYEIYTPSPAAFSVGETQTAYCRLIVREDDMKLYGFYEKSGRALFDLLISVSGLGPKSALVMLAALPSARLCAVIAGGDIHALSSVKGIGKKTAERIVLELKDKVSFGMDGGVPAPAPVKENTGKRGDATAALIGLGYTRQEASALISAVFDEALSVEELVYQALKNA